MKPLPYLILLFFFSVTMQAKTLSLEDERQQLRDSVARSDNDVYSLHAIMDLILILPDVSSEKYEYIQQGLILAEKHGLKEEVGSLYYDLAWHYFAREKKEETITNFLKVPEYSTDPELLAYAYGCLSHNYAWDGNYDVALEYANLSHEAALKTNRREIEADALLFLGDVYRYQKQMDQAMTYYDQIPELLHFKGDNQILSVHYMIVNIYTGNSYTNNKSDIKPYTSNYYGMYLKDIYDHASPRQKQMFVYHLLQGGDTAISNTRTLIKQTTKLAAAGLIVFLLLVIAAFLFFLVQIKRKANKKLEEANEMKAQLLLILNHDLRKPIASLANYLEYKKQFPNIPRKELQELDNQLLLQINKTLRGMEDLIIWSKDQMHSFSSSEKEVSVSDIFERTKDFFLSENRVDIRYEIEPSLHIKTDENYLKTIIRNLTQNAIISAVSANQPLIIWKAYRTKKQIILSIRDFGDPMKQEHINILQSHTQGEVASHGAGLIIIRDLA